MKEQLEQYVKQVKEWQEACRGNEQATKASLIAPLFKLLGYDMHDPHECKPEYRMDFGKGEKAATPVDWAILKNGRCAFFVEAKEAGSRIAKYPEQLGMYFAKQPGANGVKLGILTSGTQWQFYTDLRNENVMDTEPFFTWDVLKADPPFPADVLDLLTILQKSEFSPQRIGTFAKKRHHQALLVGVIDRLLKPSPEFVKLAIGTGVNEAGDTIVSGKITERVIEQWKPILADAIHEWARQHDLTIALQHPNAGPAFGTPHAVDTVGKKADASLFDLIAAGIFRPPLNLFRNYKGTRLEATLLGNGAVEFQGQNYNTCSAAAEAARATISGHRMNTNGWTFWQYQNAEGKKVTLADARRQVVAAPHDDASGTSTGEDSPERYRLRKKFFAGLLGNPRMKSTRHANITASVSSWIGAGSGIRGLPFNYVIGKREGRVELWINRGSGKAAENKEIFDRIQKQKAEIEKNFGGALSWERLDDKQGCRISYTTSIGGYRSDESKWPETQDAMIDAMIRLEKALAPHLAKL